MASFFKNLFRKDEESQPVPALPLTNGLPSEVRGAVFQKNGDAAPAPMSPPVGRITHEFMPAGPFSAVSGRDMTAREVAALLPPALLRFDGISPDQPISLPITSLRESMKAGRPVLKLSQIHDACPALFQRAPLPQEDSEITLPLARVKGILEFSAPMNPIASPAAASPIPPPAPAPAANPFAAISPASPPAAASPFAAAPIASGAGTGSRFAQAQGPLSAAVPSALQLESPRPFPIPAAANQITPAAPFPMAASPFAAVAPGAAASPFATVPPGPQVAPAMPFPPAAAAPAAATFPPPAAALPISPFTPMAAVKRGGPESAPLPSGPGPAALSPSPFAAVAAAPASAPTLPPFTLLQANPGASAPHPLAWLPAAMPPAKQGVPTLSPQPRTNAIPVARSAPVALTSPPAALPVPPAPLPALPPAAVLAVPASAPVSWPVTPAPVPENKAPSQPVPLATVELGLRAVLRDVDPAALGFAPENVPESVRVALPLTLVSRQLAGGRVEVGLEDLCAGIAEKFRPAFARAQEALRITIPMSEVFHNLPESARPALAPLPPTEAHRAITTSPFQTPFAIRAQEDSNRQLLDLAAAGFNPSSLSARPVTIPEPVLPPAPLPLVQPSAGAPPAVQVELPVLRPSANTPAFPAQGATTPPPVTPRLGLLSRPPGSATAPTEAPQMPKIPPCVNSVPASPTALKAFPKPPAPPPVDTSHGGAPILPSAPAIPAPSGVAELPSSEPSDDLGESFSAATLSAEPPARAGSAPVMLVPGAGAPTAPLVPISAPEPLPPGPFEIPSGVMEDRGILPETTPPSLPSEASAPAPVPWLAAPVPVGESSSVAELAQVEEITPVAEIPPVPQLSPWTPLPPVSAPLEKTEPVAAIVADPVAPASATSPLEDLTFGCNTDLRQLTLRAVLGADRILTPQEIVDRCAALPGLKACVLLEPHATLTSQGMDAGEADAFRASAAKTRDSLATLAETMGLGRSGNFTLRTDHGIRSFFLEDHLCLAVWHSQPQFSGGTREKLILIAQELAKA
jgi:hypothetical protein